MSGMTDKKRKLTQTEWDIAYRDGKDWAEHGWQLPTEEREASRQAGVRGEMARQFILGYLAGCPKSGDVVCAK